MRAGGGLLLAGNLVVVASVAAQPLTRVSVDAVGTQFNGGSSQPSTSHDGRFVAFTSASSNLPGGAANRRDIFVKDRQTGAVTRVSVRTDLAATSGDSSTPDISADGRFVTFASNAALVDADTNSCPTTQGNPLPTCPDIYVHDRQTGTTTRVSISSTSTQADGPSATPRISADGRWIVFESSANNLVAGDTNQVADVFLHDRQTGTTSRVSVSSGGGQSLVPSGSPAISGDGARVVFASDSTTIDPSPDTLPCTPAILPCTRLFVHTRADGATVRVPLQNPMISATGEPPPTTFRAHHPALAQDGRTVAFVLDVPSTTSARRTLTAITLHPFATGITRTITGISTEGAAPMSTWFGALGISANGRVVAACALYGVQNTWVVDIQDTATGLPHTVGHRNVTGYDPAMPDCDGPSLTTDGNTVFFGSSASYLIAGDTNAAADVFAINRDVDGDGMPSGWEETFGLNPNDPSDATGDPDDDDVSNQAEYAAATHPKGLFKSYLAEGADNAFFSTTINVFNPGTTNANVVVHFLGQNGATSSYPISKLYTRETGLSLLVLSSDARPGIFPDQAFSTVVESDVPVAVERSQSWGGARGIGFGSHAETAVSSPSRTWYFAEGATHGAFSLFYLLQNPGITDATVTITYLRPSPQVPIVRTYSVTANSRHTIQVDGEPGLEATDVSAQIDADVPIFAERAMYLSTPEQTFAGGTNSAGITAPATQWFVAEGSTGDFFDLFLLIGNPSAQDADVTVRYLLPDGVSFEKVYPVARQSRLTISVDGEDARLAATPVSATVNSNGVPIVVERALWWPSPLWYEGTLTAATTEGATRWALAGGYAGPAADAETYLLVANPNDQSVNVTLDIGVNGLQAIPNLELAACRVTVSMPARSRYTTGIKSLCPATGRPLMFPATFAGTIVSDGGPIVVERATYWSTSTQFWAAGESTLLTKLP